MSKRFNSDRAICKRRDFFFTRFLTQFKREIGRKWKTIERRKQRDTPIKRIVPKKGCGDR